MQNSKLIELLKTFTAKEWRESSEWVYADYFNKHEELKKLFDHLRKLAPRFHHKKIARENVYRALFPKKKYDEKHLNHLMSFLLKLVEQYISYAHYEQQPLRFNLHLLEAYSARGLDKHYKQILQQTKAKLQQYPHRNMDFYFLQHQLAEIENRHFLQQKIRKHDERLQIAADNFDLYYLSGKLKYFCEMQDRKMSLAANYELHMLPEITGYISQHSFSEYSGIEAYKIILQILETPDTTEHFFQLKKFLQQNSGHFPPDELKELYFYGINYCIRKVNSGEQNFLKELFTLYRDALTSELLFENHELSPWTYKNLVGVGLRLKEFQWVEEFIHAYNSKLSESFREHALHYNLAELCYYQGNFGKAMTHLNRVEFSDIYYSFDTKKMMLKIYFEQDETDALLSLIVSFRTFIKRNQSLSEANRLAYENFILVMQQFVKFQQQKSAPELLKKIETLKPLADRNWLLEQYHKKFRK